MVSVVRFFVNLSQMEHFEQKTLKNFRPLRIIFINLIAYNIETDEKDYQRKTLKISILDIFFDIN